VTLANAPELFYLVSMTLCEFSSLSVQQQAETVSHGDFLLFREQIVHTVLLYKVHDFFVEVYYNNESNEVVRFHPLPAVERLALYFHYN
jgi:hypothetical protein